MTTTQPSVFENPYGGTMRVMHNGLAFYDMEGKPFLFESPEQAHRVALAILTGPGKIDPEGDCPDDLSCLYDGTLEIARHFADLDARAAAEAEAAELDRRAEVAYRARYADPVLWETLPAFSKEGWRSTIRALDADAEARRLHANKETQHG